MILTSIQIKNNDIDGSVMPDFSIHLPDGNITAIYSDVDMQANLMLHLQPQNNIHLFNFQDSLYDRLTVKANLQFYLKWFDCKLMVSELIALCDLHSCANTPIQKCSPSEARRVAYAKAYMIQGDIFAFQEPIQQVDIKTVHVFRHLLQRMADENKRPLIIVSSMEHAILLSDTAYRLQASGLEAIESEQENQRVVQTTATPENPFTERLFKIPAKVDDKVILFDPTEIDYIESQSGKAFIYVHDESFALDLTLTEIEQKLELYGFYRCHRSFIVNLQKVREIITWSQNTYSLRMNNKAESTIPLSRAKLHVIHDIFNLK